MQGSCIWRAAVPLARSGLISRPCSSQSKERLQQIIQVHLRRPGRPSRIDSTISGARSVKSEPGVVAAAWADEAKTTSPSAKVQAFSGAPHGLRAGARPAEPRLLGGTVLRTPPDRRLRQGILPVRAAGTPGGAAHLIARLGGVDLGLRAQARSLEDQRAFDEFVDPLFRRHSSASWCDVGLRCSGSEFRLLSMGKVGGRRLWRRPAASWRCRSGARSAPRW